MSGAPWQTRYCKLVVCDILILYRYRGTFARIEINIALAYVRTA